MREILWKIYDIRKKPFDAEDYKIISCYLVKSYCVIFINEILLSHGGGLITKFKKGWW